MAIICKIAVPIFFMISGSLLLGREESIRDLYKKRISRIVFVLVIFSLMQYVYIIREDIHTFSIINFLRTIYSNPIIIPYWYLYSYLSFLVILPFLRKMVKKMNQTDFIYLFILWIGMSFIAPIVEKVLGIYMNDYLKCALLNTNIFFPLVGYYCEYYFENYNKRKILKYLFLFSVACIFITGVFTWSEVKMTGDIKTQRWLGSFISVPTIFIYLSFKAILEKYTLNQNITNMLCIIGKCTFGIYLLEERLRSIFLYRFIDFYKQFIGTMTSCLIGITIIIAIGTFIVLIMKRMPILRKIL